MHREAAIECFEAALRWLHHFDRQSALSAHILLGQLHLELNRPHLTAAAWRDALSLRERLLGQGASLELRSDAAQRSHDLSASLALLEVAQGEPSAAASTLERGRAVWLREALSLDEVWLAALPADAQTSIRTARTRLAGLRAGPPASAQGPNPAHVRAWEAELQRAEAELMAAQKAAGYAPPPPLDATALAALAPPGGAVLLLAATEQGGLACLLPSGCGGVLDERHSLLLPEATTDALRAAMSAWLPASGTLRARLQLSELASVNAALEELLRGLWRMVMGPVLARLSELGVQPGAELVLLPQGVLATLPLHAALDENGLAVLDDYVVRYAPSGMVLKTAMERLAQRQARGALDARGRGHDLFGVFNPMRGTKHALLNTERVEMPALQQQFEMLGQQAHVYAGADASHHQVLTGAATAGYVHFATHGRFDVNTPLASGVQLADNRWLTVREIIAELRLDGCRLVALSACETAMVDMQHQPDEYVGLPAAFLQAGAPGVLATFWHVLDGPTATLMRDFYRRHLHGPDGQGMEPAAALRAAVLDLRRAGAGAAGAARSIAIEPPNANESMEDGPLLLNSEAELATLGALPIVWAAYAFHSV
jgi:CHAT domain-containing protein